MPIGNQIQYTDNVASKIVSFTASASQTTFTITGGYRINAISVYKNGLRLTNGVDFTATDGATVILTSGASADDKVVVQVWDDINIGYIDSTPGSFSVGNELSVSGLSTVANIYSTGIITATGGFDPSGDLIGNVTASHGFRATAGGIHVVAGVSTFDGAIDANSTLDVDGDTQLDDLTVAGVATFSAYPAIDANEEIQVGTAIKLGNAGVITATTFVGALTGNASGSSTSCSGNAATATALASARTIGGVSFDGTGNINLPGVNQAGDQNTTGTAQGLSGTPSITVQDVTAEYVSIGGTLTYDDVVNVDSVGLVTARTGIQIQAGGLTISGVTTGLSVSGVTTVSEDVRVSRNFNVTGIATVTQGTDLNGYKVEEGSYDSNALNGEFDFEFENGHIQTHTGSTAGTYFPDFRVSSSQSLDSVMGVGDVVSATLIVAASNTAHYCTTGIKIDDSTSNLTIEWIGSAAASAGKGAGYDIYAFTIQKTAATPAYLIIVNALDAG